MSLQRVQIALAIAAFERSIALLQTFAPEIRSERGIAFMVDVANQHGDAGAESIFEKVRKPGLTEAELLAAMTEESVARVRTQFGDGAEVESTRARRTAFQTTELLSDAPAGSLTP